MSLRHSLNLCTCSLLLGMITLAAQAQKEKNNFVIHGSLVDLPVQPDMIYLSYDTILHRPGDSAVVKDGQYTFEGHVDEAVEVKLENHLTAETIQGMKTTANEIRFLIQPGDIQVVSTGTMHQAAITGSPAETDLLQASESMRLWGDSLRELYQLGIKTKNQMILSSIMSEKNLHKAKSLTKDGYANFIRTHPASTANIFLLRHLIAYSDDAGWTDTVAGFYHALPLTLQTSYQGRIFGTMLTRELKAAVGHKASDFTQEDANGHAVTLSAFKGKYVLLDFWASWESDNGKFPLTPMLQKIYDTYGNKGLVVVGVSLDADRDAWLQEIHDKGLASTVEVSDLKGRSNAVAQLYGISDIPMGLLIDPHGVIVARGLNALNVSKTLSAIFE